MIAAWMAYALVISVLVAAAALVAETALRLGKRQSRWAWVAGLAISAVLPLIAPRFESAVRTEKQIDGRVLLSTLGRTSFIEASPIEWIAGSEAAVTAGRSTDDWLLLGWATLSAALAGFGAIAGIQLQGRIRHSRHEEICRMTVHVTEELGPAVVGFIRPRIYVPRWLISADPATQMAVMDHEQEHLAGRDSQVLAAVLVLLVLLPWNLSLWWQARRLRFAIEVDCDTRVLKRGQDPSTYGAIMLNVATRAGNPALAAASLSEPASFLERRIRIMKTNRSRQWLPLAALLLSGSAALIATAANVSPPVAALSLLGGANDAGRLPLIHSPTAEMDQTNELLAVAVRHLYPQLAGAKQAGAPYVWAVINRDGEVARSELELREPSSLGLGDVDSAQEFTRRFGLHGAYSVYVGVPLNAGAIGPDRVTVAWAVQPDAPPMDSTAPRFPVQADANIGHAVMAKLAAQRTVIRHFDPQAIERGVPPGQELWFLMNAAGQPLKAGRRTRITDPEGARSDLQTRFPGISVSYVTWGTGVQDSHGKRIPVSWQWLATDSPPP